MEIKLTRISFEADVHDVRKAVAAVLHGPGLYDPNNKDNKGRVPNFEVIMGKSPAGRIHNKTAILRVGSNLGPRSIKWSRESRDHNIEVEKIDQCIVAVNDALDRLICLGVTEVGSKERTFRHIRRVGWQSLSQARDSKE